MWRGACQAAGGSTVPACTSGADWCSTRALSHSLVSWALLVVGCGIHYLHSCMHPLLLASPPSLTSKQSSNHHFVTRMLSWCYNVLSQAGTGSITSNFVASTYVQM